MKWSKTWKSSKHPTKQRLYQLGLPKHLQHKLMKAHLSQDLIKKYSTRSISLRTGDKVKIMKGQFKGKTGNVIKVDKKLLSVHIEGIEQIRKDGTKNPYPLNASNLMIIELNLEDKKRKQKLEKKETKK